jgi:hypothetical protein
MKPWRGELSTETLTETAACVGGGGTPALDRAPPLSQLVRRRRAKPVFRLEVAAKKELERYKERYKYSKRT